MNRLASRRVSGLLAALVVVTAVAACTQSGSTPSSGTSAAASGASGTLARIKADKTIRVGFGNEAPFAYVDGENLTGESPEVLRAFAKTIGVDKLEGVLGEFAGLIPGLQANRFDVIAAGMYIRPVRCAEVDFSNPHFQVGASVIVKKGNPLNIHSWKDIAANPAVRLGVVAGSAASEYTKYNDIKDEQVVQFPDNPSEIAALQGDRIDVMGIDTLTGYDLLEKSNDPNLEIVVLDEAPLDESGKPAVGYGAIAFRKDDDDLREAYNAWLATAKSSGELLKIIEPFGFKATEVAPVDVTAEALCKG